VIFIFAIVAFLLAEWGESFFNQQNYTQIEKKSIIGLAALGFTLSLFILIKGQPNLETRWSWIADQQTVSFQAKEMFIHPAELRDLMINPEINLKIYDLRSEEDYNLFHIENSQRISQKEISSPDFTRKTAAYPPNTVSVLIANNDVISGETWKNLKSLDYMNFYVLDGGINNWLDVFPLPMNLVRKINPSNSMDPLKYDFSISVGDREYSSFPYNVLHSEKNTAISYVKKVKLQKKTAVKGGCG
jgi:rhodanese-related sulfurtransferase